MCFKYTVMTAGSLALTHGLKVKMAGIGRPRKSSVWNYFEKDGEKCVCQVNFTRRGNEEKCGKQLVWEDALHQI